jgi:hypothetical protein
MEKNMFTQKLQDAFNACAGKIVNADELMKISMAEYASKLSPKELEVVNTLKAATEADVQIKTMSIILDDVKREKLIAAVGDGTVGMYAGDDGQVYVNANFVKFMEEALRDIVKPHMSPDLARKLDNADAEALLKARDYKDKAATLRLRPIL